MKNKFTQNMKQNKVPKNKYILQSRTEIEHIKKERTNHYNILQITQIMHYMHFQNSNLHIK